MAVGELARIIFSTTVTILLSELVRSSGREAAKAATPPKLEETQPTTPIQGNIIMSQYDLIGDDFGGVGADLIGEDALLHALSVSGFDDDDVDLIEGLGNTEIVGAAGAAPAGKKVKQALRKIAMRNAGAVVENALTRRRRYPLGFVPTVVDGGTSALLRVTIRPAAIEMMKAGIWLTRPSPMVSMLKVLRASWKSMPC